MVYALGYKSNCCNSFVFLGAVVPQLGSAQAYRSSGPGFEPRSRRILFNRKQVSTAHSILFSSAHRPDMTEILLKST